MANISREDDLRDVKKRLEEGGRWKPSRFNPNRGKERQRELQEELDEDMKKLRDLFTK